MKTAVRAASEKRKEEFVSDGKGADHGWAEHSVFGSIVTVKVERAVDILRGAGFRNTDISVLFPENEGTKDFALEKGAKAPEGTAARAGTGAVLGGALGWLVGIGALAIPGLGPFLAAGPIVGALAGVGAGGVVGGARRRADRTGYAGV